MGFVVDCIGVWFVLFVVMVSFCFVFVVVGLV